MTGAAEAAPRGDWKTVALAAAAAFFLRALRATMRLRFTGAEEIRRREREGGRMILAFWHRHLLFMPYAYRGEKISVLVSRSRDGELIARTVAHFGIGAARGSSSRGGALGLRSLLREATSGGDIAFTPDGPRGPAGIVQPGVVLAAMMSGFPIIPVAYAATRAKRLRSWDGMEVPLPFARLEFVFGPALELERGADQEAAALELARRLESAEAEALRRAGRGGRDA